MQNPKQIFTCVIIIALFTITAISGCKKESTNPLDNTPVACFTLNHDTILNLDSVFADASCSKGATSYSWTSANSVPHTAINATNYFQAYNPGTFAITLTVTNAKGTNSVTKTVFVRDYMNYDYAGVFAANDTCDTGTFGPYSITITASGYNTVTINNFATSPLNGTITDGFLSVDQTVGTAHVQVFGVLYEHDKSKLRLQSTWTDGGLTSNCVTEGRRN